MRGAAPDYARLPGVLSEIGEAAGINAALALAKAYGGQTVYIPGRAIAGHWLAETVGIEAAEKICELFRIRDGGVRLLIPMARGPIVTKALADGASIREAAAAGNVHERTAARVRSQMRQSIADDQTDLFQDDPP